MIHPIAQTKIKKCLKCEISHQIEDIASNMLSSYRTKDSLQLIHFVKALPKIRFLSQKKQLHILRISDL